MATPLDRWIVEPKRIIVHIFMHSPSEKRVFKRTPIGYVTYKKRGKRSRKWVFNCNEIENTFKGQETQ